jgi:transposase-like protein
VIDGKYLKKEQIVYAVGITNTGYKETNTENSKAVKGLLRRLIDRGLRFEEGLLFVVDGSKGIIMAIDEVFGKFGLIQRCQWHKRENVIN